MMTLKWGVAFRAIQKVLEPTSELNKRFREHMKPFVDLTVHLQSRLTEFNRRMRPVALSLPELEKQYRPHLIALVEAMQKFETFNAGLVERHQNDVLMVPPFFGELATDEFVELFRDHEKPALMVYSEFFLKQENVDKVLATWGKNRFYEDRMPIFHDAFSAHLEGKHTLSIPAFLAQVEGILCEIFDVRGHSKVKGKLKSIRFDTEDSENLFANAEIISRIITEQVFLSSDTDDSPETQYPNRHRVLHGTNPFYYKDPYASLRCILLLDLLRSDNFLALNKKDETDQG